MVATTPCFECFRRFNVIFQVFHLDVAKVYLRCCICYNDDIRMSQAYVFMCFRCFRRVFQVFHLDVAYVAMAIHACFKCMCFKCFICFILMLHLFHMDVAYVAKVIHTCFNSMFQVFHLFQTYVANI
jgi:hypothetical protein